MEATDEKNTEAIEGTETTETTNVPKEKLAPYLSEKSEKEFHYEVHQAVAQTSDKDILVTGGIILLYSLASILVASGFYRLWVYTSPEDTVYGYTSGVNAVVGGDAYNYMINATTAVAYFVAALVFVVIASSLLIMKTRKNNK